MTKEEITSMAREAGAADVGFAPLQPVDDDHFEYYRRWIDAGGNASMAYLANHMEIRRNPALLLDNGENPAPGGTVISFLFPYFSADPYRKGALRFARYALGDDYHEVLRERLRPLARRITETTGCEARICVDTAPILERYWAVRCGLGRIGRNRQLIHPRLGSHLFIAEIVTRYQFSDATDPAPGFSTTQCLDCGRCIKACPGGALSADDTFDAGRCLSYLTIEHRGDLPAGLRLPPQRIYGCDLCLEACPLSRPNPTDQPDCLPEFTPRENLLTMTAENLAQLTPESYALLFRHSPVKRAKLPSLLRNLRHLP